MRGLVCVERSSVGRDTSVCIIIAEIKKKWQEGTIVKRLHVLIFQSATMVMSRRSVNPTTLFLRRLSKRLTGNGLNQCIVQCCFFFSFDRTCR